MKYILAVMILLLSSMLAVRAQRTDSTKQRPATVQTDTLATTTPAYASENDDEFMAFLLIFAVVAFGVILTGTCLGIMITALALLLIAAMVSAGILSASVIVALYTRSISKGFKVLFVTCAVVAGGIFGCVALWTLNIFTQWYDLENAILMGIAFGLVSGLTGGLISHYIFQRLAASFKSKITIPIIPK